MKLFILNLVFFYNFCGLNSNAFTHKKDLINVSSPILKIARSIDKNEVHYFINVDKDNNLSKNEPITMLWKNHKNNGSYEKLNWIKKKYGYGLKFFNQKKDYVEFQFVSSKIKSFILKKNAKGDFGIFTNSSSATIELKQIFIHMEGGGFWTPNVTKIDLIGNREIDNTDIIETFKP
jgi:hypothetical protein